MTPNARNALKLTIAGAQITVSANGQVLGTTTGGAGGGVGLLVATSAQAGPTAGFGDFRVTPGP